MTTTTYDREREDVGNIVLFEHINITVPDLGLATLFYVNTLGFTRDPYIDLGPCLVWVNLGGQQFHLLEGEPQVVRGRIDVVMPNILTLETRLKAMADRFAGTSYAFKVGDGFVDIRCPWGNRIRCHEPSAGDRMQLGLSTVEFWVATGAADGIARFYDQVIGAPVVVAGNVCVVDAGPNQVLQFRETDDPIDAYDGHHLAVYIADFSRPHAWLAERDLIVEETDAHQYRFNWLVDPDSGERLFEVEHEVRSLHHPLYQRPLVNRNPEQDLLNYGPGRDPFMPQTAGTDSYAAFRDAITVVG